MDRSVARRGGRRFPREGDGISKRDGGARQVQAALPRLRLARAAHPLCRQRGELLCDLSDRRPSPRRSVAVQAAQSRLAAIARGMGGEGRAMKIRRALAADAQAVGRIHVESWNVAYRGIMPDDIIARTDLAYRTQFWAERIADPDWPVFLIEEHDQAVAFCQMIPTRDADDDAARVGHITSLHVLPQLRGRGYGRILIDHVFAELRRRGFVEATLWVLEENRDARRFYEKYGFHLDGGARRYPKTQVPEVRYRIRLPDSMRSGASPAPTSASGAVTFADHFSGVSAAYA